MTLQVNTQTNLPISRNPSQASNARNRDESDARSESVRAEQPTNTRPEVTEQQRSNAIEQVEQQNLRIRRDDDSELNFQARQAISRFNDVEGQAGRQDASEVLGIDLFA
ncbi:MAG: hypothetical protein V2I33_08125 [Kangiellaceae bacterium]|jgi:hypothetical protein|nr:hypothetical protein [Kangiellaceae bacterium]